MKKWLLAGAGVFLIVVAVLFFGFRQSANGGTWPLPLPAGTANVTAADLLKARDQVYIFQGQDLTGRDFSGVTAAELTATVFDTRTKWPEAGRLPAGFDPARALAAGRDPGLGVRGLQKQGITGKGVHVAVIDGPIDPAHKEFGGAMRYTVMDQKARLLRHFHGAATASILGGKNVGVAPDVVLHYYALTQLGDFAGIAASIDRILKENEQAPAAERIRVISISMGMPNDEFRAATQRAEAAGVAVIHCGDWAGLQFIATGAAPGADRSDPESYGIWLRLQRLNPSWKPGGLLAVPADYRTTADVAGKEVYTFWGEGGQSWAAPYLAGVIALGMQVNPSLTPAAAYQALRETATTNKQGLAVINPAGFIAAVKQ